MKGRKLKKAALALCLMTLFVLAGCNEPAVEELEVIRISETTTGTTAETTTETTSEGTLSDADLKKIEENKEEADIDIIEDKRIRDFVNEYVEDPSWNFMNMEHLDLEPEDKDWIVEGISITTRGGKLKNKKAYLFASYDHAMEYVKGANMELIFEDQEDGSKKYYNTGDSKKEKDYYGTIYPDGFVLECLDFK